MWGTCNTDIDAQQCSTNMAWFADNIKTQCKKDIAANNSIVTDAVAGEPPSAFPGIFLSAPGMAQGAPFTD